MLVLGLWMILISLPVFGSREITSQIYGIDYGKNQNEEALLFLTSGEILKLNSNHEDLISDLRASKSNKGWFKFFIDKNRLLTGIKRVKNHQIDQNHLHQSFFETYVPTTIESMKVARKYHREARYKPKESQCFNRAMVWSYEWWRKHSLKSMKLLIYFSRSYIRRYNFEWWFHIAPYVHVMHEGKVVERVMDIKYTSGPMDFESWKNIFMRNNAPCPVINKFSDYADYPYSGDCFLQRTHMYTYQPADLQMYEAWGYEKIEFNMNELRSAYLEAFDEKI